MPRKRVISIRFCAESKADMELYARLEQEAGTSASLASVVKARIKASYARQELIEFQEKIVEAVREEIQESGMKVIETLLSNSDGGNVVQPVFQSTLPEKSKELPTGALDFLE